MTTSLLLRVSDDVAVVTTSLLLRVSDDVAVVQGE